MLIAYLNYNLKTILAGADRASKCSVRECNVTPTFNQERERLLVAREKQIRHLELHMKSNFDLSPVF